MTEEKWQQLKGELQDRCQAFEIQKRPGDFAGEEIETVLFTNQIGEFRLVRVVKPRVLGEKTYYSGRLAASTGIEKIYSDTETVDMVKLFRNQNGDWEEIDIRALG